MCAPNDPGSSDPLAACSHDRWLPLFRRHTLRTVLLELPQAFVEYLMEDGIYLAATSEAVGCSRVVAAWAGGSALAWQLHTCMGQEDHGAPAPPCCTCARSSDFQFPLSQTMLIFIL